jgi:hypothetical protein
MTAKTFWEELSLPQDTGIDALEQRFLEVVKEHIQSVAESYNEQQVAREEEWLRQFHKQFFEFVIHWVREENKANRLGKVKDHPDAVKLKIAAQGVIQGLQENMIQFASCYMQINRYVTLLRDEIKREEIKAGALATNVKWTSDIGIALARCKKQRQQIKADNKQMDEIQPLLEEIESHLSRLRRYMTALQGAEKSETFMRSLIATLRTMNFNRARTLLGEAVDSKKRFTMDQKEADDLQKNIEKTGKKLLEIVSANMEKLKGPDNKLFLRPMEMGLARNAQVVEMKKIRVFLSKYHLPYMQYKVDTLHHLKDKLLVVSSLESLMTLYKRLMVGLSQPMPDIKSVRIYENEVMERIKYLLDTQLQEAPKIRDRARETVEEFRSGRAEFEEIQQMKLEEVPLPPDEEQAAGAVG